MEHPADAVGLLKQNQCRFCWLFAAWAAARSGEAGSGLALAQTLGRTVRPCLRIFDRTADARPNAQCKT